MRVHGDNPTTCERGFSLMNQVKTTHRNRLSHATLRDIMTVTLSPFSPEVIDYPSIFQKFSSVKLDSAV